MLLQSFENLRIDLLVHAGVGSWDMSQVSHPLQVQHGQVVSHFFNWHWNHLLGRLYHEKGYKEAENV